MLFSMVEEISLRQWSVLILAEKGPYAKFSFCPLPIIDIKYFTLLFQSRLQWSCYSKTTYNGGIKSLDPEPFSPGMHSVWCVCPLLYFSWLPLVVCENSSVIGYKWLWYEWILLGKVWEQDKGYADGFLRSLSDYADPPRTALFKSGEVLCLWLFKDAAGFQCTIPCFK